MYAFPHPVPLDFEAVSMVRTPYASDTLVDTRHRLAVLLGLLSARVPEDLCPLEYLGGIHVLDALGHLLAVDVVADDDGVFPGPGRDGHLDLGVRLGEGGEEGLEEGAGQEMISIGLDSTCNI